MSLTANKTARTSGTQYLSFGDISVVHTGYGQIVVAPKAKTREPEKWERKERMAETLPRRTRYLTGKAPKGKKAASGREAYASVIDGWVEEQEEKTAPTKKQAAPNAAPTAEALAMHAEHSEFLDRMSRGEEAPISRLTAMRAQVAWQEIWKATGYAINIPAACAGPDGKMFYSWDRGRHHLELEIFPGAVAEFFYRDRETGTLWGEDYRIGDPLPSEAVAKLQFFI